MAQPKSFFASLFDFSFSEFIVLKVVSVLYGVAIFVIGVACLSVIGAGFNQGFAPGLLTLVLAPLIFLLYVIFVRVVLEGIIFAYRTAENTTRIAENTRSLRNP